jgi:hypothetical protein
VSPVEQSAEGATEYSPEGSAAKLRDIVFSASNPCQGVTEFAKLSLSQPKTDSLAPFQGLSPVYSTTPEFRCAPLRALSRRARWALRIPRAGRSRAFALRALLI